MSRQIENSMISRTENLAKDMAILEDESSTQEEKTLARERIIQATGRDIVNTPLTTDPNGKGRPSLIVNSVDSRRSYRSRNFIELDNSVEDKNIRNQMSSVASLRSGENPDIINPSTGNTNSASSPSTSLLSGATFEKESGTMERSSVSNIREEANHTGKGISGALGTTQPVFNSPSTSRAIASTTSEENNQTQGNT